MRCRSEEHTSELQSQFHLVCRLLLEKKNTADARRNRDVKQWAKTDSGTILPFPKSTHHRVAIDDGIYPETLPDRGDQIEIVPAPDVCRADHALGGEVNWPSKADSARLDAKPFFF